ncbi:hypothetical protein NL676_024317 [Syzygium grande]|nr:hypothetical protein NL676_024317 [Syzygium grande]
MNTVGLPKRVSFEIGPYFPTLSWSHFSPVFVLMARSRSMLWPTMGIPNDPGGSFLDDPLLLLQLNRKRTGRRKRRRVIKTFIVVGVEYDDFRVLVLHGLVLLLLTHNALGIDELEAAEFEVMSLIVLGWKVDASKENVTKDLRISCVFISSISVLELFSGSAPQATNETKAHTPSKGESEGFQKGKAPRPKAYYTQQARPGFSVQRQP